MTPKCEGLLEQMERELKRDHAHHQGETTLWHYTDAFGAEGILRNREIWATHYSFLNDRRELIHGEEVAAKAIEELATEQSGSIRYVLADCIQAKGMELTGVYKDEGIFVASFCEDEGDGLSQWRAYGAACAGYSIAFSNVQGGASDVEHAGDAAAMLVKIDYDEDSFRLLVKDEMLSYAQGIVRYCETYPECHRELERAGILQMKMKQATLAMRLKDSAFRDEREWRLVVVPTRRLEAKSGEPVVRHRATPRGFIPYAALALSHGTTIPLKAVRCGPAHDPERGLLALSGFLKSLGYSEELALKSRIPFRT